MHTVPGFIKNGFRHKRGALAPGLRHILDNVLDYHRLVGHLGHFAHFGLYLLLSGASDLMMMIFDLNAPVFERSAHLVSKLEVHISGQICVIAGLFRKLVTRTALGCVPISLIALYSEKRLMRLRAESDRIKYMELEFRSDYHLVCNTGFLHVFNRALGNVARVLVKWAV